MRILFLTNFFPPARSGGYTQWCHEISESLAARGHTVGVLTSSYELEKAPAREENVFRTLHLEGDLNYYQPGQFFLYWKKQLRGNLESLERTVESFAPDLIFIWGMWALSKSRAAHMEKLMPGRVVYYLSDYWPIATDMHTTYWTSPARRWPTRVPKKFLSKAALKILAGEGQPALELTHVLEIDTTRPELIPACVALVAHPDDERFRPLFGRDVITPLFGARVPLCPHPLADPEKGTVIAMICTFGDVTDVTWWRELGLPVRAVLAPNGTLRPVTWGAPGWESTDAARAQHYYDHLEQLPVAKARQRIVEQLASRVISSASLVRSPTRSSSSKRAIARSRSSPAGNGSSRRWSCVTRWSSGAANCAGTRPTCARASRTG